MKNYRLSEELGNIDEEFLEEVFEYRRKGSAWKRFAAIAACAAIAVGVGAAVLKRHEKIPLERISADTDIIVSHSFEDTNSDIIDATDVDDVEIRSYFEVPIDCNGYRYVLKKVEYSATIPEYIAEEDIIWRLGVDLSFLEPVDPDKPNGPFKAKLVTDFLDENGKYFGETEHIWVFVTLEVTNLSDEAVKQDISMHYLNYDRPENHFCMRLGKVTVVPGEEFPEEFTANTYHRTDPTEIDLGPNETKTVIFGYLIDSDYIPGSLEMCLECKTPEIIRMPNNDTVLPLK